MVGRNVFWEARPFIYKFRAAQIMMTQDVASLVLNASSCLQLHVLDECTLH